MAARTILVPLDGSTLGERAVPWAALMARELGLSLTLARVVPWPHVPAAPFGGGYISPEVFDEIITAEHQAAQEYLDRLRSEWSKESLDVSIVIRDGMAAEGILDAADELGAYAIAIASHGRGGARRLVLGSVAERLLQQATIPVLLVRATDSARPAFLHRILVPLDGSALAERAIDQARAILPEDGVLVLERVVVPIYHAPPENAGAMIQDEQATAAAEAQAGLYIDRKKDMLVAAGIRTAIHVDRGRPATEILAAAKRSDVNLIVMTTHGQTGPARWLTGSVADEVFRNSDVPILLVSARTVSAQISRAFTVEDVMTRDVVAVVDSEPIITVLQKLLRRRISGAPVVSAEGKLIGIVTEHDLVEWHTATLKELSRNQTDLDPARYGERLEMDTVATIASRPAVTIEARADLNTAIALLTDREVQRLVVTSQDKLAGILSRADILKAMAEQWRGTQER